MENPGIDPGTPRMLSEYSTSEPVPLEPWKIKADTNITLPPNTLVLRSKPAASPYLHASRQGNKTSLY